MTRSIACRAAWAALLLLCACKRSDVQAEQSVVARIDAQPVYRQEVAQAFAARMQAFAQDNWPLSVQDKQSLWQASLEDVVQQRLLLAAAQAQQVSVLDDEVEAAYRRLLAGWPAEALAQQMQLVQQTPPRLRAALRNYLQVGKFLQRGTLTRVAVSDADIDAYAQAQPDCLERPEQWRLRDIRVADLARAEELKKALQRGMSIDEAALRFGEKPNNGASGDLGWLHAQALPSAVSAVIKPLPSKRLSPPVQAADGVHLFWLSDRLPAGRQSLASMRRVLDKKLTRAAQGEAEAQALQRLKDLSHVEILDAALPEPLPDNLAPSPS